MKILLTGSDGYIATNLKARFPQHTYVCVDRKCGLEVLEYSNFSSIEAIIHLAAQSTITKCDINPELTIQDNISGCLHLFSNAAKNKIPVIFASSQAVKSPADSLYAKTKFIGEELSGTFNSIGAQITSFRFANVYGGQNFLEGSDSVIAKFIRNIQNKEKLVIFGDGSQRRDFIHVNDICDALEKALHIKYKGVLELGTGKSISIKEIALSLSHKSNILFEENSNLIGVKDNFADDTLARQILNFEPKENLFKYLKQYETT